MQNINENVKDPSHPWFWLILRLFYLWQFSLDSNLVLIADDEFKPRISVQEKTEMRIPTQFMKWFKIISLCVKLDKTCHIPRLN